MKVEYWTPAEDNKLYRLFIIEGKSARDSGKILGRTRNACIGRRHREFPEAVISKKKWVLDVTNLMFELRDKGVSFSIIAEIVGFSENYVRFQHDILAPILPTEESSPEFPLSPAFFDTQCEHMDEERCRLTSQPGWHLCGAHLP